MRRRPLSAALVGWIRLLPGADGYGIPLFKSTGNAAMTAETDDDLVIVSFNEFYNEAGYAISHALPPGHAGRRYKAGDKVPIPLVVEGNVEVVEASVTEQSFLAAHRRSADAPAVTAVAGFLKSAASGEFRARSAERIARRLRLEHDEVLGGDPAHSAYWVQKLGLLGVAVKRMPKEERDLAHQVVSERATAWLARFGSKSEPGMLVRFLKAIADDRGARNPAIRDAVFTAVLSRFATGSSSAKDDDRLLAAARPWLPGGLHGHFLKHGFPEGLPKKEHARVRDLPRLVLEAIDEDDATDALFNRSLSLAKAVFADGDLPLDVSEFVHRRAQDRMRALRAEMKRARADGGDRPGPPSLTSEQVRHLLGENDRVVALYRILHGEDRLAYSPDKSQVHFGISEDDVEFLYSASSSPASSPAARPRRKPSRGSR